jgi:hypothetical protein
VTTTTLRGVVCGLNLLPLLGLEIEAEEVVEGNSLVVNTTMTTEQVDFTIKKGGCSICARGWGSTDGVLVLRSRGCFTFCTFPGKSIDC